jgi:hypothetical protein
VSQTTAKLLVSDGTSAMGFFHEKVKEAQKRQNVNLSEDIEFYVVNLLTEYVSHKTPQGENDCLALMLARALESPTQERFLIYKQMGDTALYFSGFFQDYFNTKSFDVSYYMSMGGNAYSQLAGLAKGNASYGAGMAKTFQGLSVQFSTAVDVIMDVSENTTGRSTAATRSLLSVYDAWLGTASQKLERELFERGVIPVPSSRKTKN